MSIVRWNLRPVIFGVDFGTCYESNLVCDQVALMEVSLSEQILYESCAK